MDWNRDDGLRIRMVLALGLSVLGYAVLLVPVGLLLPFEAAVAVGILIVLVIGVLVREADRLTYIATRAIAIEREDHPGLFDTVERLSRQADMQRPPIAVIPSDRPNALSAGTGDRTVVCVTLGLLKTLEGDQLEAVLAHELAHVKNADSSVLTVAGFPTTVALAGLSTSLGHLDRRSFLVGQQVGVAVGLAAVSLALLVVSLPGTLTLARYREYAADRGAVALTGEPVALARALSTLHEHENPPDADLRSVATFNAFCFVPSGTGLLRLPWTHPPADERIRALRRLQEDLETASTG
jgi:heat shock protein HtpX